MTRLTKKEIREIREKTKDYDKHKVVDEIVFSYDNKEFLNESEHQNFLRKNRLDNILDDKKINKKKLKIYKRSIITDENGNFIGTIMFL